MANLIPIGRFSKMTRLSVKALRRYDRLGLLVPAVIDPSSSYRYYTYSQANRAEAIRILRRLDMPLEQIRELLESDDAQVTAKLLQMHRRRLEDELQRHRRKLAFIERLIEREESVLPYDVRVKDVPAQHVATIRRATTMETIGPDIADSFARIGRALERATMTGPPFVVFDDVIDEEGGGDIQVAAPVAVGFQDTDDVRGEEFPATTVAWTVHHGPFDEIGPAYHTVAGWIQEHGHEVAGPPREVYLTDPDKTPDEADYLTEVQFPIRH
jgi:effector-binding domain-containing protein